MRLRIDTGTNGLMRALSVSWSSRECVNVLQVEERATASGMGRKSMVCLMTSSLRDDTRETPDFAVKDGGEEWPSVFVEFPNVFDFFDFGIMIAVVKGVCVFKYKNDFD